MFEVHPETVAVLKELAKTTVHDMGDVFYDPTTFGDYTLCKDATEVVIEDCDPTERLLENVIENVFEALVNAYLIGERNAMLYAVNTLVQRKAKQEETI